MNRPESGPEPVLSAISLDPLEGDHRRLAVSLREAALAAGVDDFLRKPLDPDELRMRLHVAERILGAVRTPITGLTDEPIQVGASVGVAVYPADGDDGAALQPQLPFGAQNPRYRQRIVAP